MDMKSVDVTQPSKDEPIGAVETLLGIGDLIAAVFAMQPTSEENEPTVEREFTLRRIRGNGLNASTTQTLIDALAQYNEA